MTKDSIPRPTRRGPAWCRWTTPPWPSTDTGGPGQSPCSTSMAQSATQAHWRRVVAELGRSGRHITYDERPAAEIGAFEGLFASRPRSGCRRRSRGPGRGAGAAWSAGPDGAPVAVHWAEPESGPTWARSWSTARPLRHGSTRLPRAADPAAVPPDGLVHRRWCARWACRADDRWTAGGAATSSSASRPRA